MRTEVVWGGVNASLNILDQNGDIRGKREEAWAETGMSVGWGPRPEES